jgi:hypothetical protein
MGSDALVFVELVKYDREKDGKKYTNIGLRLDNGYVIPVNTITGKHYYQLRDLATLIVIESKKKGE